MRNVRCLSTYALPAPTTPSPEGTAAPYTCAEYCCVHYIPPVFFNETNILLAVIGLVGVLGTGGSDVRLRPRTTCALNLCTLAGALFFMFFI